MPVACRCLGTNKEQMRALQMLTSSLNRGLKTDVTKPLAILKGANAVNLGKTTLLTDKKEKMNADSDEDSDDDYHVNDFRPGTAMYRSASGANGGRGGGGGARDRTAKSTVMITNRGQLRKNVERAMRKLFDKKLISDDPKVVEQRQIDFAWTLVDWRTFDPESPLKAFPGDVIMKQPSALEALVLNLKNATNPEVHYASCCAIAYLCVRQDVRAALYEATVGILMESLDLFVARWPRCARVLAFCASASPRPRSASQIGRASCRERV